MLGDVRIAELPLTFFPLERNVLSLELDDSFRDLYLLRDPTALFLMARGLMEIQQKHGLFPRIVGKGDNARKIADLLARMRQELLAGEDEASEAGRLALAPSMTVEGLVIIDREVDLVTPLLTQLTYEGLIDELFGIEHNQTKVDSTTVAGSGGTGASNASGTSASASNAAASNAPSTASTSRKRVIQLDSTDKLFSEVRDSNFAVVGSQLHSTAKRLQKFQSDYESKQRTLPIAELKEFVSKLPGFQAEQQSVGIHSSLAEEIMKHTRTDAFMGLLSVQQNLVAGADPSSQVTAMEELMARDAPIREVLRLLCLYSCISGGVKPKEFDQLRRLVLQAYGYQHVLTLGSLEKLQLFLSRSSPLAGMIPMAVGGGGSSDSAGAKGTKTNYTYLRRQLRLVVDEVREDDPNDVAYVYSGYAPLSIRLVQCVLQKQYLLATVKSGVGAAAAATITAASTANTTSSTPSLPPVPAAQGWHGFEDAVKHVRGPTVYELQKGEDKAVKARALLTGGGGGGSGGSGVKPTVFVVFVGGVTFTEIAALRFIAKQEECKIIRPPLLINMNQPANEDQQTARRNIVICTTSIISGNRMMDAVIETGSYAPASIATPATA